MDRCDQRLQYYHGKARAHLSRVRLSHLLALKSLHADTFNDRERELCRACFGDNGARVDKERLCRVFNEIHLVALESDFELYLNRVLTTLWTEQLDSFIRNPRIRKTVVRAIAEVMAAEDDRNDRDALVERLVPRFGLKQLWGVAREDDRHRYDRRPKPQRTKLLGADLRGVRGAASGGTSRQSNRRSVSEGGQQALASL